MPAPLSHIAASSRVALLLLATVSMPALALAAPDIGLGPVAGANGGNGANASGAAGGAGGVGGLAGDASVKGGSGGVGGVNGGGTAGGGPAGGATGPEFQGTGTGGGPDSGGGGGRSSTSVAGAGGGGGGGGRGATVATSLTNVSTIAGGNGGNGGNGAPDGGWVGGGGGGGGGAGAVLNGTSIVNSGSITGGNGGNGGLGTGDSYVSSLDDGTGGTGGSGIVVNTTSGATIVNSGSIIGGYGGTGNGPQGAAGVGISGQNLTITNSGSITAGNGSGDIDALRFTGGANALTLTNATSGLTGHIAVQTGSLTFVQPTDVTIANAITGAGSIVKIGAGVLTLTGNNSYSGGTTVSQGTLVGSAANIRGALANNGLVIFNQGSAGTFAGDISGNGSLTKDGDGNLTLSGVNSSTGPTLIRAGTLTLAGGNAIGDNALVVIDSGAALAVAESETIGSLAGGAGASVMIAGGQVLTTGNNWASTFSGTISGEGGIRQNFAGTTTFTGVSAYSGATEVANGTLIVNGSIVSSSGVTVAPGATLGGSGQLPSTRVLGAISPGNSPGTLTVSGNLTLTASSLYIAEVQGNVSDRIDVTGSASLAGTLRIVPLGGRYSFNSPYTLLSATGGASGEFGAIDTAGSFGFGITTAVAYTGTDVVLTLAPRKIATPGDPANAFAVTSAIDDVVARGADASALFGLYDLPQAAIQSAANQLSGEIHTGVSALASRATGQFLGTMLDGGLAGRLQQAGPAPEATTFSSRLGKGDDVPAKSGVLDAPRFSLWGATSGSSGRTDGSAAIGSARRSLDDAHLAVGADFRIGTASVAGIAVSGGKGRASLPGGTGKIESDVFQAGLYGATRLGVVNLAAAGGFARLDNDITRAVPLLGNALASSYASTAWSGRFQASAAVASWNGFTVSPLAALQAVHVLSPAFREQAGVGGNAAALEVDKRSGLTSRSELGAQIDMQTQLAGVPVTGFIKAAWAHYFERDALLTATLAVLPGATFTANGAKPARNGALLAAGADAKLSERVSLGVRLESELSANARSLGGTAQLRVSF